MKGRWGRPVRFGSPAPRRRGAAAAAWATPHEAARLCLAPSTLRRTLKIALIVGTLLSLINQGDIILAGQANVLTWVRVLANYVIPWAVSSVGFLSARAGRATAGSGRA